MNASSSLYAKSLQRSVVSLGFDASLKEKSNIVTVAGSSYWISLTAVLCKVNCLAAEQRNFNATPYAIALGNMKTDRTFDNPSNKKRRFKDESLMKHWLTG